MNPKLTFNPHAPTAPRGLGGLVADHFGNGRLFAKICAHGGLTEIGCWGRQKLGAGCFFRGEPQTAWVKLFRVYAGVGEARHYLPLNDTCLYPFGYSSRADVAGVHFRHEMLLLPDALVQRFRVLGNPGRNPVRIEMLHQEAITATNRDLRTWGHMAFDVSLNALIASCTDQNPVVRKEGSDGSLAQEGMPIEVRDTTKATTWVGIGCDSMLSHHCGYHARSKHYLAGSKIKRDSAAIFLVFANSRNELESRLKCISQSVHFECDALLDGYADRLRARPQVETGNKVLNSAFSQYPEVIEHMKLPDRPGAVRATLAGYFVWCWDALNAPMAGCLANEPDGAAEVLRFFQQTRHKTLGFPHTFTTSFQPFNKASFASQFQFIAALYHYVSTTGDLDLAEELMPSCKFLLDRCRERIVKGTGLVEGVALWPDFPEAMEETGHDISSMNNSLVYQGLRAMEFLAAALGVSKLAIECRDWAKALRTGFVKHLYDEEMGFFISSCDSRTFRPRKHYCPQSIFWLTPFARELVSHAPQRIADFLNKELRSDKCLLTLPHWDSAWMADGNQLGSSFPAADHFYLNAQKLVANAAGLQQWLGDVEWFWHRHTAPEAFTPEALNDADFGVDNPGCKQLQACATWYVGLYTGLAGLDFDHEGLTVTPWGDHPLRIANLRLQGCSVNLEIKGAGSHVRSLKLNGRVLPAGSRKILWSQLKGKSARIELVRSPRAPACPVVVRADGLRVEVIECTKGRLRARVDALGSGEILVQAPASAAIELNGRRIQPAHDPSTNTYAIPFSPGSAAMLEVSCCGNLSNKRST